MKGGVHTAQRHDSALKHVTGQALYIDDMPEPAGTLHAALVLSPVAHGRLKKVEVPSAPDVVAVLGPTNPLSGGSADQIESRPTTCPFSTSGTPSQARK